MLTVIMFGMDSPNRYCSPHHADQKAQHVYMLKT